MMEVRVDRCSNMQIEYSERSPPTDHVIETESFNEFVLQKMADALMYMAFPKGVDLGYDEDDENE